MTGLTTKKVIKKQKKHGNKSGRKTSVRPSQKKSVKNGRHQEVDGPKKTVKIKKAIKSIPANLEGPILDDTFTVEDNEAADNAFSTLDENGELFW